MLGYEEHIKSLKPAKPADLNPKNDILTPDSHTPYLFQPYSPSENQCYIDKALNYIIPPKLPIKKYKKKDYKWNTKVEAYNEGTVDFEGNFVTKDCSNHWYISDDTTINEQMNDDTTKSYDSANVNGCKKEYINEQVNTKLNLQEMEAGKLTNQIQNSYTPDEMVLKEELGELNGKYVKRVCDSCYVQYERLAKEIENPFFSNKLDEYYDKIKKEAQKTAKTEENVSDSTTESKKNISKESVDERQEKDKVCDRKENNSESTDSKKNKTYKHEGYENTTISTDSIKNERQERNNEKTTNDRNTYKNMHMHKTGNDTKHDRYVKNKKQYGMKEVESKFEMMNIKNMKILEHKKNTFNNNQINDNNVKKEFENVEPTDTHTKNNVEGTYIANVKNEPKFTKYKKTYETEKEHKIHTRDMKNDGNNEFDTKIEMCNKSIKFLENYNYTTIKALAYKIKGKQKENAIKIIQQETKMKKIDCEDFLDIFLRECKSKILCDVDLEGFEMKRK
ncbi:hypothetical protein BDAP_002318 [Binucleata daphniae]